MKFCVASEIASVTLRMMSRVYGTMQLDGVEGNVRLSDLPVVTGAPGSRMQGRRAEQGEQGYPDPCAACG